MSRNEELERALRSAKASLAMEGLHLTSKEEERIKAVLQNKMSMAEFRRQVLEELDRER